MALVNKKCCGVYNLFGIDLFWMHRSNNPCLNRHCRNRNDNFRRKSSASTSTAKPFFDFFHKPRSIIRLEPSWRVLYPSLNGDINIERNNQEIYLLTNIWI